MKSKDQECAQKLLRVLPRISRFAGAEMKRLGTKGATLHQFRLLARLSHCPMTNRQLADAMGVSPPALSKGVGSFLKQGRVKQVRDATDRREILISLTPKGEAQLGDLTEVIQELNAQRISALTDSQKEQMSRGLTILILEDVFTHALRGSRARRGYSAGAHPEGLFRPARQACHEYAGIKA